MTASNVAAFAAAAQSSGTAAAALVSACDQTIAHPEFLTARGGGDADTWPGAAMACAFAYRATQSSQYLTQAIKYWNAALDDDQMLDDGQGCVYPYGGADWRTWDGSGAPPPVIVTVSHDTGYPMRWYGPYVALAYDWLYDAPGVDETLRAHTRFCLESWVEYYTESGYHRDEPGSNYNAGFVLGKTLAAVAIGTDDAAGGNTPSPGPVLWTETLALFRDLLVGEGLAGAATGVGTPAGVMLGGDWGEGWQYGPLSVAEYAAASRVLADNGAALPEMAAWTDSLMVRYAYATVPTLDGQLVGGDFDSDRVYQAPQDLQLAAVLLGPSSAAAASWAKSMQAAQAASLGHPSGSLILWRAIADLRDIAPEDFAAQSPVPPLWYLARGTRTMYARTGWDAGAFWAAFTSAPQVNADHHHFDASNFVFSRGGDHLIVDASTYGARGTLPSNAVTADSAVVTGTYAPSQTPWSEAELLWARGTTAGVYAARGDIAKAFVFSSTPSDIPYARRDWVFLPEGEIVTIDRVHTSAASRGMYVGFHANSAGTLQLGGNIATGTVGGSKVAIHKVHVSGGAPAIQHPPTGGDCHDGTCTNTRFATDEYTLKVPGPWAVAVHAIDGLAAGDAPADVGSLNSTGYDPAQANGAVVGAGVYRGGKQSYVVASSVLDGAVAGGSMSYGVPAAGPARHVVFDAPEDGGGRSLVTAAPDGDRCVVTVTAGAGFAGHPLMFAVSEAAAGCQVVEDVDVAPGAAPPGGGEEFGPAGPVVGGCSCALSSASPSPSPDGPRAPLTAFGICALVLAARRRRQWRRQTIAAVE